MKTYAWSFIFFFSFGLYTLSAQNWKITQSDNTVILIGEGWIKTLPANAGSEEGTSDEYEYDMYDEEEEDNTITMYNYSENRIVIINEAEQTYASGTAEEYCNALRAMREGVDAAMMQQMIADQKAMPAPKFLVTHEKGESILGYSTTKYFIESSTGFFEEKWISNDPALKEINHAVKEMMRFSSRIVSCSVPDDSFLKGMPEFSDAYKPIREAGFELKSNQYDEYGSESGNEVISIEKGVSSSEFEIPQGYSKRSFNDFIKSM